MKSIDQCLRILAFVLLIGLICAGNHSRKSLPDSLKQSSLVTHPDFRSSNHRKEPDAAAQARIGLSYGKLPLRFEANRGQTDARVKFIARGSGYALFLTSDEAVLRLRQIETERRRDGETVAGGQEDETNSQSATLRMQLIGSNATPQVSGAEQLQTESHYLIGDDPRRWRVGVAGFGRVKYDQVWPGVDLVYYGNQRQLEYDFIVAPGAKAGLINLAFMGADEIKIDERGDLALNVAGRNVRWEKPVAWQEINGERRSVSCDYKINARRQIGFELGQYDTAHPLVIDPALVYSTFLGGSSFDSALDIALDSAGAAYVCGATASADFPSINAAQPNKAGAANSDSLDAFVAKLNASGSAVVYSTFIGGSSDDTANSIAVDASGAAYVAGETLSSDFPRTAGAFQQASAGLNEAFVVKLHPSGSSFVYSTLIGGNGIDRAFAVAVDGGGGAFLAGQTDSTNFPTAGATTARNGAPFFKSVNSGANWNQSGGGLTASFIQAIAVDPAEANNIYAASNFGLFKSTDGGDQWRFVGAPPAVLGVQPAVTSLAIDPRSPVTIYLGTFAGVFKSVNGGQNFEQKTAGITAGSINALAIDPMTPAVIYAGTPGGVFKTTNGGESWALASNGLTDRFPNGAPLFVRKLAIDPANPATVYAGTLRGVFKTTDRAAAWAAANTGLPFNQGGLGPDIFSITIDLASPATLYVSSLIVPGIVFKTTNGGASWQAGNPDLGVTVNGNILRFPATALAANGATVYAGTPIGVFKSVDSGVGWGLSATGLTTRTVSALLINSANTSTIYAGMNVGSDAFAARLNPDGSALVYSRYLGGDEFDVGRSIVVDAAGSAWVTGQTSSANFPLAVPTQNTSGSSGDAFVTKINATGSSLLFSTYLGGTLIDIGSGIALDSSGAAYVTGWTQSRDLPTVNPIYNSFAGGLFDAFVAKYKADGSAIEYSTYLGGVNTDQAFAIAADAAGNAYVAGATSSQNFPALGAAQTYKGSNDGFVSKLNPNGSRLLYSTFLGGGSNEQINGVAVDASGAAYVAGTTTSADFPVVNPAQQFKGFSEGFVAKLGPSADLAVTMTDAPDPVVAGGNLTYTIVVRNDGELNATGVTLTDTPPAGSTVVSAVPTQGGCGGAATITCNLGNLNAGASVTITIVIKAPARDTITNTATVAGAEPDPVNGNNTATETTQVEFTDLSLDITPSHLRIEAGGKLTWILTVRNNGPRNANNVTVNDNLPPETTFVSCRVVGGGTCGGAGNNRLVTIPTLEINTTASVILSATVNNVAAGVNINNTASVGPASSDPNPANNQATTTTVVIPPFTERKNGAIAFVATENGAHFINLVRADGSGQFFFAEAGSGTFPAWSPDGTRLAFVGSSYDIVIINPDGTGRRSLPIQAPYPSTPTWSPDGTRIAFSAPFGIYIINADGAGEKQVAQFQVEPISGSLRWAPDGSRLLFSNGKVNTIFLDGSDRLQLTTSGDARDEQASWSPDGSKIVFSSNRDNGSNSNIYVMNADGGGVTRLTNNSQIEIFPTWSPDGSKIVFSRAGELYVMNPDGSGQRPLGSKPVRGGLFGIDWRRGPAAAEPNTYVIYGKVMDRSGRLPNARIELSGSRTSLISTDLNGNYSIGNLNEGGDYKITVTHPAFSFDPPSRTYNNLRADVINADFTATFRRLSISGRITDGDGVAMGGVFIQLFPVGGPIRVTQTDAQGSYIFDNLFGGIDYAVVPSGFTFNDRFTPSSINFAALSESKTANFTGSRGRLALDGKVIDSAGAGVNAATVTISGGGSNASVMTDAEGKYSFGELPGGFVYTVRVEKQGLSFIPASRNVILNRALSLNFFSGVSPATTVSAASFSPQAVATSGIAALFGVGLSGSVKAATDLPLPLELDGVSVTLTGRNADDRPCQLFFVSPQQINFLIPLSFSPFDAVTGETLVTVKRDGRVVAAGLTQIERVAPSLFTANASGQGVAAAVALRVKADGSQVFEPVSQFDPAQNRVVAVPIDLSNPAEQVFLILFGTGIRHLSDLLALGARIGGEDAEALFAGDQGGFAGLDQVNLRIPPTLRGRGDVTVELTVDGKTANTVMVNIR